MGNAKKKYSKTASLIDIDYSCQLDMYFICKNNLEEITTGRIVNFMPLSVIMYYCHSNAMFYSFITEKKLWFIVNGVHVVYL